jgi:hypothetical protein
VRAATATSSGRLQAGTFATRQRERGKRSVMPSRLWHPVRAAPRLQVGRDELVRTFGPLPMPVSGRSQPRVIDGSSPTRDA